MFSHQEEILVCCRCCAAYHTFCLDPPWEHPPSTDWRCTKCLSEEYNRPAEVYGFEQAKKEYSLREYARMANDFKEEYFSLALEVGAELHGVWGGGEGRGGEYRRPALCVSL